MIKNIFLFFFIILTLFVSSVPINAQDRVYLEIGSAETRKIHFAVPWFISKKTNSHENNFGKELADTLAKSLKFHGVITIIPTATYNGAQRSDWKNLGADFAVLGHFESNSNSISLELRLLDVAANKVILGKSYSGKMNQKREMLYRFCDTVMEDLTGSKGLAGSQICFVSQDKNTKRTEVFVADILGRSLRQITRHKNLVVSPRFHPDGNHLSYTSYHTGNQNLYITDLRQNKTTRVLSQRRGMNLAPAWAPNGNHFILTLSYKGNPDLYRLNKQGQVLEQLTGKSGINVSASYSPDGKKVVFVSDRFGSPQLFLMDVKTRKTQRLTFEGSENAEPSWHPREDLIVYSSLRNGVYQICTKRPKLGEEAKQVTTDLSHHESPSWSPDGNQIIFSKQDGRQHKIYAMMKNGSYQRKLFSFSGSQTYPRWAFKQ